MVPIPASKRRKLSHSSQDEGDDQKSFASFGSSNEAHDSSGSRAPPAVDMRPKVLKQNDQSALEEKKRKRLHSYQNGDSSAALANGSYKSNLFKLQVDELLKEIRPQHKSREKQAETVLHKLKNEIENLPSRAPATVVDAERHLITTAGVAVPFPQPRPPVDAQYKLQFVAPTSINVVGSHVLGTRTKTNQPLSIDMLVTIPSTTFEDKDYLNHRYFYKRAYYLACLAAGVQKAFGKEFSIRFAALQNDPLKPILVIESKSTEARHAWRINILLGVAPDTFASEKLLPRKNAVRSQTRSSDQSTPTPFYNSSVRADSLHTSYLKLLHSTAASCAGFKDACLLANVWLDQRGHSSSIALGGFGHFEFAALMASLLKRQQPKLSMAYTSYQLFKGTLQYIVATDMVKSPIVVDANIDVSQVQNNMPIFFDGPRSHNILYKMSPWSYSLLRADAKIAMKTLGDSSAAAFQATFITKLDKPHLRFDSFVTTPLTQLAAKSPDDHQALLTLSDMYNVLSRGLGDRVTFIGLSNTPQTAWEIGSARPSVTRAGLCTIALSLSSANENRLVDFGPSAEGKMAAAEFRKFWGEKAELRRFRDGSILESLVWSRKDHSPPIVEQIIRHLLFRHFGLADQETVKFSQQGTALETKHDATARHQVALDAYKRLESDIRGLEQLPLSIRQISAIDSQLRSTALDTVRSSRPSEVVVQFESSARWPDDLVAIQRVKIAFLLKIGELLESKGSDITTRIGLENCAVEVLNQAFLDVHYPDACSFRLRINADKEQSLIEKQVKDKSAAPTTRESAALALAEHNKLYKARPAHTQLVQKLCTEHPSLAPAILTLKKWFAAHLLTADFPEELIELFVIRTYTASWPWQAPPSSAKTGFLRTLDFLASWDWQSEPLIVTSSASPGSGSSLDAKATQNSIRTRFEAWRTVDPAMSRVALFVACLSSASATDIDGTIYTSRGGGQVAVPSKLLAGRMSDLARAAVTSINTQGLDLDYESLFASPLTDYDFVLHFKPGFGGTKAKKRDQSSGSIKYKNLIKIPGSEDISGAEIAEMFVDDLRGCFGQTAVFLYGGGSVVGALWNPFFTRRPWKVNLSYGTKPIVESKDGEEPVLAEVNKTGILGEIARLGDDMLEKVTVNAAT